MRLSLCGLLLLPGLAIAVSPPTQPVQPTYQLVEALGTSDVYASLAINPANDQPQVAYIDTSGLDNLQPRPAPLWVRAYDGWIWRREQLGSVPMTGDVLTDRSRELRFLVDTQGRQHAVLIEPHGPGDADNVLVYLRRDASGATRTVLDTANVAFPTFTLGVNDEPRIAWLRNYQSTSGGVLEVRLRNADGSFAVTAVGAAAGGIDRPVFAAPAQPASNAVAHLIWIESAGTLQHVRHALINGPTVQTVDVASFDTAAGRRVQWQYLAAAPDGSVEAAIVVVNPPVVVGPPLQHTVEHRRLAAGASAWACPASGCVVDLPPLSSQGTSGRALSLGPDGRRALSFRDLDLQYGLRRADPPRGVPWQGVQILSLAKLQDTVHDRFGNLYAVGPDFSAHRDLTLMHEAGPWHTAPIPTQAGVELAGVPAAMSFAEDADGAPVAYGRRNAADGSGALWTLSPGGFVEHPLPAGLRVLQSQLRVAEDGAYHLVLADQISGNILHARKAATVGASWVLQQVSDGEVPASHPSFDFGPGGTLRVCYWQNQGVYVAGTRSDGSWRRGPVDGPVTEQSRPRIVSAAPAHVAFLSWFDTLGQKLRVVTLAGNFDDTAPVSVIDRTPPEQPGWVQGASAHDIAVVDDGRLGLAYSETVDGQHRLAYANYLNGAWSSLGSEPTEFGAEPILTVSLAPTYHWSRAPRLAYVRGLTSATSQLYFAEKGNISTSWRTHALGFYPESAVVLSAGSEVRIAYADAGVLRVARRRTAIEPEGPNMPLWIDRMAGALFGWCLCHTGGDQLAAFCRGEAVFRGTGNNPSSSDVIRRAVQRFDSTPAGRYYSDLARTHGAEIMALTATDPTRLEQRLRTLADLLPGLSAFADGDGSAFRLKPEMLTSARAVWQGWAAAGSPELAAAVNLELTRSNDLQDYANLDFETWFAGLQAGPPPPPMFADGFE